MSTPHKKLSEMYQTIQESIAFGGMICPKIYKPEQQGECPRGLKDVAENEKCDTCWWDYLNDKEQA